ncbi:hypothetical protein BDR26DRAFT_938012 [Obelidium mucronatum]|nr:hypothetical protein BDR26DRAFT_938012 [Obelidium mucronatum]
MRGQFIEEVLCIRRKPWRQQPPTVTVAMTPIAIAPTTALSTTISASSSAMNIDEPNDSNHHWEPGLFPETPDQQSHTVSQTPFPDTTRSTANLPASQRDVPIIHHSSLSAFNLVLSTIFNDFNDFQQFSAIATVATSQSWLIAQHLLLSVFQRFSASVVSGTGHDADGGGSLWRGHWSCEQPAHHFSKWEQGPLIANLSKPDMPEHYMMALLNGHAGASPCIYCMVQQSYMHWTEFPELTQDSAKHQAACAIRTPIRTPIRETIRSSTRIQIGSEWEETRIGLHSEGPIGLLALLAAS